MLRSEQNTCARIRKACARGAMRKMLIQLGFRCATAVGVILASVLVQQGDNSGSGDQGRRVRRLAGLLVCLLGQALLL